MLSSQISNYEDKTVKMKKISGNYYATPDRLHNVPYIIRFFSSEIFHFTTNRLNNNRITPFNKKIN
jgi:hypothetical protein